MREVEEIAWDLCDLYHTSKSPINENGGVEYYLAGSLASLPLICADKIEDVIVSDNRVISIENAREIDDDTKLIFQQYRKQIHDVDYVSVNSSPNIAGVIKGLSSIKDFDNISKVGPNVVRIEDVLTNNNDYNLCRLTYGNRQIIVLSPLDIVSYKLSQCVHRKISLRKWLSKDQDERTERMIKRHLEGYNNNIKDLIPLLRGTCRLYSTNIVSSRIYEVLKNLDFLDFEIIEEIKNELTNYPEIVEVLDIIELNKTR